MPYTFKRTPKDHQLKVWEATKEKTNWGYFMERGTGKTKVYIDTLAYQYYNKYITAAILFAKKGEYRNPGIFEFPEDWPDDLPITLRNWGDKNVTDLLRNDESFKVLLINVESFQHSGGKFAMELIKRHRGKIAIFGDESTAIKNHKVKRTAEAYKMRLYASSIARIGTGSHVTESPIDLWGQCNFLKKGILGHSSFYTYRNEYCILERQFFGSRSFDKVTGFKNLEALKRKLKEFSTTMSKDECVDLPEKIYQRINVPLTPEQERVYAQLRDLAIVEVQGETITVENVLALVTKLHQVVAGQLKLENEYASLENNRLPLLLDLLEDIPGKVIVWSNYRQTVADIYTAVAEKFGYETVAHYYGATDQADRDLALVNFQNRDHPLRFLIANQRTGGYGLTLTAANTNIYYSNGYSCEQRLQSEDRTHRIGQTNKVLYIDFVTPDTIDEKIYHALRMKKELAEFFLRSDEPLMKQVIDLFS